MYKTVSKLTSTHQVKLYRIRKCHTFHEKNLNKKYFYLPNKSFQIEFSILTLLLFPTTRPYLLICLNCYFCLESGDKENEIN